MKIGSICYATSRGLGHLARDFYLNKIITDVFVVEHSSIPTNRDWYPGAPSCPIRRLDRNKMKDFCRGKDAMLFFETPFDWSLIDYCRLNRIRTYLMVMHECTPATHIKPHKYLCPSLLDMQYFPVDSVFLPIPVSVPWKLREKALHYIHNGGYLGLRGREGTRLLIEAMEYVKSPLQLTIRVQENVEDRYIKMIARDPRIDYRPQNVPFEELHSTGDVYVAPQKFNGCSLPLQEAFASGMLIISTDRFPMNTWLPRAPLIPIEGINPNVSIGGPYMKFDEAIINPKQIAATMDSWYGCDITSFSQEGVRWAADHSWEVLGPKYLEELSK